MAVTKDAIAHFDWSYFIIQELCEEIQEFKKDSQKSKTIKTRTVGGCLYFLMLFCFQHFPLGDCDRHTHGRYTTCNKKCRRFKDTLSEEARHEGEAAYNQPTTSDESDDDDGEGHDTRGGRTRVEGDDIIDIEEDTQHGEETPTHVDGGLGGNRREFVDMHHYFLTREELQCLTPRSWINNKLMTMVAKTLVAD
ncbi:hypothetical protein K1719_042210 [Acacia pycnantha]|nr:hypothetical protein K1719_042210 [Acacia pycnantha]